MVVSEKVQDVCLIYSLLELEKDLSFQVDENFTAVIKIS